MKSSDEIVIKKLKGSGIVWFQASNQWLYLEEPALYVLEQYMKNYPLKDISDKCSIRYNISGKESINFVNDLLSSFSKFKSPPQNISNQKSLSEIKNEVPERKIFSKHIYSINKKHISISFDSRLSEYYIHPLLAHLESEHDTDTDAEFEVFIHDEAPLLLMKNNPEYPIILENFNYLKRKLFIEISNIIYNKSNDNWMTFLHAGGISKGRKAILLSSASGSGKSTMTALLHAKGFNYVSDDFVPIDVDKNYVYPFPAAISIKKGSFSLLSPHYENLEDENYNIYPFAHNSVRYLKPSPSVEFSYKPLSVKAIVFITYNTEFPFKLSELSISESLKLFHEQARVSHDPKHARTFIDWFLKLKCFKMQYSDKEQAINAILNLFD